MKVLQETGAAFLLARFETPHQLLAAARRVQELGYRRWDTHSPFPLHGMGEAMGLEPSPIGRFCLAGALGGALGGLVLQGWTSVVAYPLVVSGKPLFSWPAFVPICFELAVLGGVLGALAAFLGFARLPRLHHPLFASSNFEAVTDDGFFLSIEAVDPLFELDQTRDLLRSFKATQIEVIPSVL